MLDEVVLVSLSHARSMISSREAPGCGKGGAFIEVVGMNSKSCVASTAFEAAVIAASSINSASVKGTRA